MKNKILNIIIAGTGGQGVITLSNTVRRLALENNFGCEGATFKGGAQRMGTVYAELRLILDPQLTYPISSQIPPGEVDVLLGLEPWETLRFAKLCHSETKVVSNSEIEKLYIDRMEKEANSNPITELEKRFKHLIIRNFTNQSLQEKGTKKATNSFLLNAAIANGYLPFTMEQLNKLQ